MILAETQKYSKSTDVLLLLEAQYAVLNKLIAGLQHQKTDTLMKRTHFCDFISILKAHSAAKAHTLYDILKDIDDAKVITYDVIEEQAAANILIEQLEELDYKNQWSPKIEAKAMILTEIVRQLLEAEQGDFFSQAKTLLCQEERCIIGDQFAEEFEQA